VNILTIDIEEWFHLLNVDYLITDKQFEGRIENNVERLFSILEATDTKATFFILGSIAKNYPLLVKKIAERYDIGTHGYSHQLVSRFTKEEFKEDLQKSIKTIEDITRKKVNKYRAPGFSIRNKNYFEVISESGIEIDCSASSIKNSYGDKILNESRPCVICFEKIAIKEMPASVIGFLNKNIGFLGGGYFRLFPYWLIKRWTKELQDDYLLSYIHPRDLDYGQPMLKNLPMIRKFKSYVGLKGAEKKLRQWLNDFRFTDIATAEKDIDWDNVPVVKLN
jgi:Predicted xylanase/chitin deacetylase